MTHADFRKKQREMDDAGMVSHIRTIRVSKNLLRTATGFDDRIIEVYRYKYRYEVILNGDIVKTSKTRGTAKKYLLDLYHEKMSVLSI